MSLGSPFNQWDCHHPIQIINMRARTHTYSHTHTQRNLHSQVITSVARMNCPLFKKVDLSAMTGALCAELVHQLPNLKCRWHRTQQMKRREGEVWNRVAGFCQRFLLCVRFNGVSRMGPDCRYVRNVSIKSFLKRRRRGTDVWQPVVSF